MYHRFPTEKLTQYTHLSASRIEIIRFVTYIDQIAFCKDNLRVKKKASKAFSRHFLSWIQLSAAAGGKDSTRIFNSGD